MTARRIGAELSLLHQGSDQRARIYILSRGLAGPQPMEIHMWRETLATVSTYAARLRFAQSRDGARRT